MVLKCLMTVLQLEPRMGTVSYQHLNKDYILLTIEDDGKGMDLKSLEKLLLVAVY